MPTYFTTPDGRRIAYHFTAGAFPGVVFLGGFASDMNGTKAVHLENWAKAQGRAFLRFDYSGHGQSSGAFTDGCIGDWLADARAVIAAIMPAPWVLVGSSMGGWISLLLAREMPERIAGFVGLATAPDFTEDSMHQSFTPEQKAALKTEGQIALPSQYGDAPYIITQRLIEDGRGHLLLRGPLVLPFPARLLQGTADEDVPVNTALRLFDHAQGDDLRLTLIKGADHRLSDPRSLQIITQTLNDIFNKNGVNHAENL